MWEAVNRWRGLAIGAGARHGVPLWVILSTIAKESGGDPTAFAGVGDGRGLMQLTVATARGLGFTGEVAELFRPEISVELGAKLLAQLRARYPSEPWDHIYSAYRAGRLRLTDAGALLPRDEVYVVGWRRAADWFRPGWRNLGPFEPAPRAGGLPVPLVLAAGSLCLYLPGSHCWQPAHRDPNSGGGHENESGNSDV